MLLLVAMLKLVRLSSRTHTSWMISCPRQRFCVEIGITIQSQYVTMGKAGTICNHTYFIVWPSLDQLWFGIGFTIAIVGIRFLCCYRQWWWRDKISDEENNPWCTDCIPAITIVITWNLIKQTIDQLLYYGVRSNAAICNEYQIGCQWHKTKCYHGNQCMSFS